LVRRIHKCVFRLAEVVDVDLEHRFIETDEGQISYDCLVVAAGS
jgi:NADH dehydrogenase FAD-containing subunit